MADTTPYTDDDVADMAKQICGRGMAEDGSWKLYIPDARRLLDAGYRKVTPDTPPEPQERYYPEGFTIRDRQNPDWRPTKDDAGRIAALLNLDAKYEDGIEAEVERLRLLLEEQTIEAVGQRERAAGAEARERELIDESERRRTWEARAKELEANLATARLALSHLRASFDDTYQRESEARAEIERLAALVREVAGAGVASTNRKYVEVQIDVDTWADLSAEISEPPAVPQDDGPTEPLFTGKLIGHSEYAGGGCEVVLDLPDWPGDDALRVTREVDVWPAGVRPAAPTVTASDIAVAVETAAIAPGGTWSIPVGGFDGLADALNRLLAERLPAAADPLTWQIGQVEAWGWHPAMSAAPADCTGECGDGECNCSGEYRVLSWAPPEDRR